MSFKKIFVAGHNGMVGSSIVRLLKKKKNIQIFTAYLSEQEELEKNKTYSYLRNIQPDYIIIAAAKVGGIYANDTYPADFIYENLIIECNLIKSAFETGVKNLMFLGSSCIYPRNASQPIKESDLLTGSLELTNEPYAVAKIAGIKLCESFNRQYGCDYRSIMPTNLYGIGDNYHEKNAHVIPSLIRRIAHAKKNNISEIKVWGSGRPMREFLFSEDLASACFFVMNIPKIFFNHHISSQCSHINVGYGKDISIENLVNLITKVIGYEGNILYDNSKPDGTFRKLLDSSLIENLGWKAQTALEKGLITTYQDFQKKHWGEI